MVGLRYARGSVSSCIWLILSWVTAAASPILVQSLLQVVGQVLPPGASFGFGGFSSLISESIKTIPTEGTHGLGRGEGIGVVREIIWNFLLIEHHVSSGIPPNTLSLGCPRDLPGGRLFSIIDQLGSLEVLSYTTKLVLGFLPIVNAGRLRGVV